MQPIKSNSEIQANHTVQPIKLAQQKELTKSNKLSNVCYDIRGPVLQRARQMEDEGQRIIKLNIGNPGVFGLDVPEEMMQDVMRNMSKAGVYTDSKGLFEPRKVYYALHAKQTYCWRNSR